MSRLSTEKIKEMREDAKGLHERMWQCCGWAKMVLDALEDNDRLRTALRAITEAESAGDMHFTAMEALEEPEPEEEGDDEP